MIWERKYTAPVYSPSPEIVTLSYSADDTFNVIRAEEDSVAKSWKANDFIATVLTKGKIKELEDDIDYLLFLHDNINITVPANSQSIVDSFSVSDYISRKYCIELCSDNNELYQSFECLVQNTISGVSFVTFAIVGDKINRSVLTNEDSGMVSVFLRNGLPVNLHVKARIIY